MSRHSTGPIHPGLAALYLDQVRGRLLALTPATAAGAQGVAAILQVIEAAWPDLCAGSPTPDPPCPPDPAVVPVEQTPARALTLCELTLGKVAATGAAYGPRPVLGRISEALRDHWEAITGQAHPKAPWPTTGRHGSRSA